MHRQVVGIVLLDLAGERLAVKYAARSLMLHGSPQGANLSAPCKAKSSHHVSRQYAAKTQSAVSTSGTVSLRDFEGQRRFEMHLSTKADKMTFRAEAEVLLVGDYVALFRTLNDVVVYVIGEGDENELLLAEVLNTVTQSLTTLTGTTSVSKRAVLENLGNVFLMLDEILDGGVIMETDSRLITNRVLMQENPEAPPETTAFNQAISNARENLFRSFLSGTS